VTQQTEGDDAGHHSRGVADGETHGDRGRPREQHDAGPSESARATRREHPSHATGPTTAPTSRKKPFGERKREQEGEERADGHRWSTSARHRTEAYTPTSLG
jgi:hypothetical protein